MIYIWLTNALTTLPSQAPDAAYKAHLPFNFSLCYPRGLIRYTTVGGTAPRKYANSIFHCATQGGSFVTPPLGAIPHFWLQIQFSFALSQGGSFVTPPLGAIPHFWLQLQHSIVLSQGGSFVTPPLGAIPCFSLCFRTHQYLNVQIDSILKKKVQFWSQQNAMIIRLQLSQCLH